MPNTTTNVGKSNLPFPDLGYEGGATLHGLVEALIEFSSNQTNIFWSGSLTVANSGTTNVIHNLGIAATELKYLIVESGVLRTKAQVTADYSITQVDTDTIQILNQSGGSKTFEIYVALNPKISTSDLDAASGIATLTGSETLTNKTLATPYVTNASDLEDLGAAPANPSAGRLRFYSEAGVLKTRNSSGSVVTIGAGVSDLNGLIASTQTFATGTSGTDFAISSVGSTHTFNIPDASATARGLVNTGAQSIDGVKTYSSTIVGSISGNAGTVTNGAYVNVGNVFTVAQSITAASNQLVLYSGVNQLTLNSGTSAAARTYTIPDVGTTGTFAMLEGAQTFSGLKTFSSGLTVTGGTSANNTIYLQTNVFSIRGGSSGFHVRSTGDVANLQVTDTGAVTLGPANSTLVHVANGSGLSVRSSSVSNGGYIEGQQNGTAQWFVGKHPYNLFPATTFGIGSVSASVDVTFGSGNIIAGGISTTSSWQLGATTGTDTVEHIATAYTSGYSFSINNRAASNSVLAFGTSAGAARAAIVVPNAGGFEIRNVANTATLAGTDSGAWTLGPTAGAAVTHSVYSNRASTSDGVVPFAIFSTGSNSDQKYLQCYYNSSTAGGGLARSAATSNITLFNASDRRIKTNIVVSSDNHLEKLTQIVLKKYDWKSGATGGFGPIAQELAAIYPDKVSMTDDGAGDDIPEGGSAWSIQESWSYELIAAIQELKAELDAATARIQDLENA